MLVTWELEDRHRCRYLGKRKRNKTIDARRILIPHIQPAGQGGGTISSFSFKFSYFLRLEQPLQLHQPYTSCARVRASSLYHQLQRGPGPLLVLHNNNNIKHPERAARGRSRYLHLGALGKTTVATIIFPIIIFGSPFILRDLFCCAGSDR